MPLSSLHDPIIDVLHDIRVIDPYRWLEDGHAIETREWLRHQEILLNDYFSGISGLSWLRARVSDLLNVDVADQPLYQGKFLFYRRRRKNQEQPSICVQDLASGEERTLVDLSSSNVQTSIAIHRVSYDASLLAYEVKHGGSDSKKIRILNINNLQTLAETIDLGYGGGIVFAPDNQGFYYCPESGIVDKHHVIHFHRLGEPASRDEEVFRLPRTSTSRLVLLGDEVHLGAAYSDHRGGEVATDLYLAIISPVPEWRKLFSSKRAPFAVILKNGRIFACDHAGAVNCQIVECNHDGSVLRTIVPMREAAIRAFTVTSTHAYACYERDQESEIHSWTLSGRYDALIPTPRRGAVQFVRHLGDGTGLDFVFQSFTVPSTIFHYSPDSGSVSVWSKPDLPFDSDRYCVRRQTYPSQDGTNIPISLVMAKELEPAKERPAIMTGYGGFGIPMTPQFSVLVAVMLELGATFALPHIRGGSEFGEQWHEAARGRKRQVAISDFLSAARWLCEQQVTLPRKLAIFGGSNSGLLVGAAMTQAPCLFRSVLCIAPILDMVRYEQFGGAAKWRPEYGSVEDPEDFRALYAYSPYHHVQPDVDYPATYFVSGDKDERCDPAHVRKMAALLQNRPGQKKRILVDYSPERGHSPVLPLSIRIDALTRRIAFLCKELEIQVSPGGQI